MPAQTSADEMFAYIRVVLSIVTGLGLTYLLQGLARFIQHPKQNKVYLPHLLWSIALVMRLLHFWWFEHALGRVQLWTYDLYLLIVSFGIVNYLLCTLLYPSDLTEYKDYREYFLSRKTWFFSLLIISFVIDFADSLVKGPEYFASLGTVYLVRSAIIMILAVIALFTKSERYQYFFATVYLLLQFMWIFTMYMLPRS